MTHTSSASEQRYQTLFQASSSPIMLLKNNRFYDCNQATLDIFGIASKEDFCRFHPAELSPPHQANGQDSQIAANAYIAQAIEQGSAHFPWIHRRLDGKDFPTQVQLTAIHIGDTVEIQAIVTDLSALQASEQRLQQVLDFLPSGVGVNVDGILAYANPKLANMFGYAHPQHILGTRLLDYVAEEDRMRAKQRKQYIRETGRTTPETEMHFLRKDGAHFTAAVQSQAFTFEGQESILVVLRDIEEFKQEHDKASLLMQAIMQSHESIMLLGISGQVILCNPAAASIYHRTPEQMMGLPAAELRGGQVGDALYQEIIQTIQNGHTWEGEMRLEHHGVLHQVSRRVSPVLNEQGHIQYQIVVDRDITEERKQQEKLEHTQRLESLGILAGGIAHDFNNLLTSIMGHAALARMEASPLDKSIEHFSAIEETSQRAADLCKQMLAYSGKGKFITQTIDLSEMVREMMRLLEVSIHKSIVVRYHLYPNLPAIEVDVSQLQQIIMNLVINANEAIGDTSGSISLATGVLYADETYLNAMHLDKDNLHAGHYVYLEISDTGCGMTEETKKRLFEPFYTTKFTGRGLGMSAILGIVRGHQGSIQVYSEEGKGTTFKVLFPALQHGVPTSTPLQKSSEKTTRAERGTILVVDDEESIREVACMMLEDAGYQTIQAVDGLDAVEKLQEHTPDVDAVLLDMTMPRMGGEDAFSEMRRIQQDIPVILSSGYTEQDATQRFSGKGLAGFIQKPYPPEQLIQKIAEVLNANVE